MEHHSILKALALFLLFIFFKNGSFAQGRILDQNKYADCLLTISIDYKNMDENYLEAKKYTDIEIVLIRAKDNGHIVSIDRGFIKTWRSKNGTKGVFFEHKPSPENKANSAYFPTFNEKGTYCYSAKCYDSK